MRWTTKIIGGLTASLAIAGPLGAKEDAIATPSEVTDVLACRAISDQAARLSCFDKTVAVLDSSTASGAVIAVNREAVRRTRRGLFGFAPSIGAMFKPLLGRGDPDEPEITRIDTTVDSVGKNRDGEWRLHFAEGGSWEQTDTKDFVMSPKVGQKASIERGLFGSYFVSVNGQPGIKMHRVE